MDVAHPLTNGVSPFIERWLDAGALKIKRHCPAIEAQALVGRTTVFATMEAHTECSEDRGEGECQAFWDFLSFTFR